MNELNQLRFQPELFFKNLLKICLTYCKCWRSVPLASPTLFCNIQHLISQLKEERNKKEKEEEEEKKKVDQISHLPSGRDLTSEFPHSLSFYLHTI